MKRIALTALVLAMIGSGELLAVDDPAELARLTAKIKALEAEVAALKKKVAMLEQRPPSGATPGEVVPKGWQPREYNGHRYFAIPLNRQ